MKNKTFKSKFTCYVLKRKDTASIWRNMDFISEGSHLVGYFAYRTRKEAIAECDCRKEKYGTEWEVVTCKERK